MQEKNKKKNKEETSNEIIAGLNSRIKELEEKILYKDAELINYRK